MTRTFIALKMDESLQRILGRLLLRMRQELPRLHWVDPVGIHLTLAFLGELADDQLAEAISATEIAAQQTTPFSYSLSHPGLFGSPRQPRVIWVGIEEPTGKLSHLHRALNIELERRGFEIDKRPFSPHLTLSRVKVPLKPDEQERLQRLIAGMQVPAPSPLYQVSQVSVMKSELFRTGAKYTSLRDCNLRAE